MQQGFHARGPPVLASTPAASSIITLCFSFSRTRRIKMRLLWINNDGGGFADYVDVAPNTTVEKFLNEKLPESNAEDYLIRVNRQPVPRDYVLREGDRVTMTPTKIDGAGA